MGSTEDTKAEAPVVKVTKAATPTPPPPPKLFVRIIVPGNHLAIALPNGNHYTPDDSNEFEISPEDVDWFKNRSVYQTYWR